MTSSQLDYDQIAPHYDQRFAYQREREGIVKALRKLVEKLKAGRILEVGCGTGHWLDKLQPVAQKLVGLDLSAGMLSQARRRQMPAECVQGYARRLPFRSRTFDLVFCVNAIHHFEAPRAFVRESSRILRAGGVLAVVGSDPHGQRDSWYIYQYFAGTWETDLQRFPEWEIVSDWMAREGFERLDLKEVERIDDPKHGREVFDDPFLRKNACSQLALLSDEAYEASLRKIESALAQAEARGGSIVFQSAFSIAMLTGYKA